MAMRIVAVLWLASAVFAGCDAGPRPQEAPIVAPVPAAPEGAETRAQDDPSGEQQLDRGQISLRSEEGGFLLLANAAPRIDVLRALQWEEGFSLEIAEGAQLGPPLTIRLVDATRDDVLALALAGVRHSLRYGPVAGGERPLLEVRVGDAGAPSPPLARSRPPRHSEAERSGLSEAERRERHERNQAERTRDLSSSDPAARFEAATWIHADHRTIPLLGDALLHDPSSAVRAAAAATLGESTDEYDARGAVDLLLQALEDPDTRVVLTALEALESVGDASVIPRLESLLAHPDPAVREQVVSTIAWVED
jgi:hypothetical protein